MRAARRPEQDVGLNPLSVTGLFLVWRDQLERAFYATGTG
jgi:hypothetical protein